LFRIWTELLTFIKKLLILKLCKKRHFGQTRLRYGKVALCSFGNTTELKETTLIIEVDNHKEAVEKIKANGGKIIKIAEPYENVSVYNVIFIDTKNNQLVASKMA
jgi:hypothetical protein